MFKKAETAWVNVGDPMVCRFRGAEGSRGPWTPRVIMTMRTVAMMEMVQGQEARETKRMLWGRHMAHMERAAMMVKTTVQVAWSLTVSGGVSRVVDDRRVVLVGWELLTQADGEGHEGGGADECHVDEEADGEDTFDPGAAENPSVVDDVEHVGVLPPVLD